MEQYIDKAAVLAKIDDWRDKIEKAILTVPLDGHQRADAAFEYEILGKVRDFLNAFESKEVDLEKEKDDYWNKLCDSEFGELLERDAKWFDDIAKHFFELGMAVGNKA